MDSALPGNWKLPSLQHIDSIVSKSTRNLGLVKLIEKHFKSVVFCIALNKSLVRSHLEYDCFLHLEQKPRFILVD